MKPSHLHIALLLAGICAAGTGQAQTGSYQFINLGGGSAAGINDLGQVVGQTSLGATLWNGTTATVLAGGPGSYASAINNAGLIVGGSNSYNSGPVYGSGKPVEWTGTAQAPLQVGLGGNGWAYGINQSGQVVGNANGNAATWSSDNIPTGLPVSVLAYRISGTGINNAGQAAGYVDSGSSYYAVSWSGANGSKGTLLPSLGGSFSQADAINNKGAIVGQSTNTAGALYATEWNGGSATELQSLGGQRSYAYGINDAGVIVGSSTNTAGQVFATLWNGTSAVNLNNYLTPAEKQAGWVLTEATGINQNGWIIGDAVNTRSGSSDAFELRVSPVPEASTWAMLLAGLALIGALTRFKPTQVRTTPTS